MPAPRVGCLGRCSLLDVDCRPEKRVRRSSVRTRFVLNFRQSRSGATGKERRENDARAADEEFAFSRRAELLCRAGLTCAANASLAPVEPVKVSRTEGVPALRSAVKSGAGQFRETQERAGQRIRSVVRSRDAETKP